MTDRRVFVVVTYDIRDDYRRNRVSAILADYGMRVQYSVFECRISEAHLFELRQALAEVIQVSAGDSVRFYVLCERDAHQVERLGGPTPWSQVTVWV